MDLMLEALNGNTEFTIKEGPSRWEIMIAQYNSGPNGTGQEKVQFTFESKQSKKIYTSNFLILSSTRLLNDKKGDSWIFEGYIFPYTNFLGWGFGDVSDHMRLQFSIEYNSRRRKGKLKLLDIYWNDSEENYKIELQKIPSSSMVIGSANNEIVLATLPGLLVLLRDNVVSKDNFLVSADTEGKVTKILSPYDQGRGSDIIQVDFNGGIYHMKFKDLILYRL